MYKYFYILRYILLALAINVILLTNVAHADAGLVPSIVTELTLNGAAHGGLIVSTACFGLLAVIAIELIVIIIINRGSGFGFRRSLWVSFLANIISTIGGLVLWALNNVVPVWVLIPLEVVVMTMLVFHVTKSKRMGWLVALSITIGSCGVYLAGMAYALGVWAIWSSIILVLLMNFGVTIAIEAWGFRLYLPPKNFVKTLVAANTCSYILLIFITPFYWENPYYLAEKYQPIRRMIYKGQVEKAIRVAELSTMTVPQILGFKSVSSKRELTSFFKVREAEVSFDLYCIIGYVPENEEKLKIDDVCRSIVEYTDYLISDTDAWVTFRLCGIKWINAAAKIWPEIVEVIDDDNKELFASAVGKWHEAELALDCGRKIEFYEPGGSLKADLENCIDRYLKANNISEYKAQWVKSALAGLKLGK